MPLESADDDDAASLKQRVQRVIEEDRALFNALNEWRIFQFAGGVRLFDRRSGTFVGPEEYIWIQIQIQI